MDKFKKWATAAGVRAIKTIAQTAVATIGVSAALSDVDWILVISSSILAGIISMLTSVAGIPEVDDGEPLPEIVEKQENHGTDSASVERRERKD